MRLFVLAALLVTGVASAQVMPPAAVGPWQLLGTSIELTGPQRAWLAEQIDLVTAQALANAETFETHARPASLNVSQLAQKIKVGEARLPALRHLILQPILCAVGPRLDVLMTASRLDNDQLVGIMLIPLDRAAYVQGDLPALPVGDILQQLSTLATQAPIPHQNHALQLDIRASKPWTRLDHGHHSCLDLRLAQMLYLRWPLVNFIGREYRVHVRQTSKAVPEKALRPSRVILSQWHHGANAYEHGFTLSESIFGQRFGAGALAQSRYTIGGDGWFVPEGAAALTEALVIEQESLQLAEWPQIAKIHGAWVYLDKGRAYGLKMNDRLVVAPGEPDIKGHVVGFFGSNLKLQSPRGFAIQEGAIVYVRLGQRDTRIGQSLIFDPKQYPTKWPPN